MADAEITSRPQRKPTSLTIARSGNTFNVGWKVPDAAKSGSASDRFLTVWANWAIYCGDAAGNNIVIPYACDYTNGVTSTSASNTYANFYGASQKLGSAWYGKMLARAAFYPHTGVKVSKVTFEAMGRNGYGNGPSASVSYSFKAPRAPSVTASFDDTTRVATWKVTTDAGADERERYDTRWRVMLRVTGEADKVLKAWATTTSTEFSWSFDFTSLGIDFAGSLKSARVWVEAYARGIGGDSATTTRTVTCAYPRGAKIKSITSTSGGKGQGKITIAVSPGSFVTSCQLQRLTDVSASVAANGVPSGTWSDVNGASDDANCTALYDMVVDAVSEAGTYTWYRLKISNCGWHNYSCATRADCIFVPAPEEASAKGDKCGIVSVTPTASGATVVIGFTSYDTASRGVELSWATTSTAWASSNGPSTAAFSDASYARDSKSKSTAWAYTKTVVISGLSQDSAYYLRARRYHDGSARTWSAYTSTVQFSTTGAAQDKCGIVSVEPLSNGDVRVVTGFTIYDVSSRGLELSWSTSGVAWWTSEGATVTDFSDDEIRRDSPSKSSAWTYTKTVRLSRLDQGATYYLRARRYMKGSGTTYGAYTSVMQFVTESAADDECGIVSATPAKSGTAATVVVGFTEDNMNTGTELAWSANRDAWTSTEQPSSFLAAWEDSESQSDDWDGTATIQLAGLEPGTVYYLRARRYLVRGGTTTYSPWSSIVPIETAMDDASDDKCGIVSATPSKAGASATVIVGFTENNANTGTELAWSTSRSAWTSTEQPQTFRATWKDSESESGDWGSTATIVLSGLTAGTVYYLRARRYLEGGAETTYSPWSPIFSLESSTETAEDAACAIVETNTELDGTGLYVLIGFKEDASNTGTQLTWSKDPNAWRSSESPSETSFTWRDSASQSSDWPKTAVCHLRGLDPGETYYLKARRYLETDGGTTYTPWSERISAVPANPPKAAALYAPSYVLRGRDLEVSWDYEGDAEQVAWAVHPSSSPMTSWAHGTSAASFATIPASRLESLDEASLFVTIQAGGGSVDSEVVTVKIADAPVAELPAVETLTAQPLSFEAYCSDAGAELLVTVEAVGVSASEPGGDRDQLPGDVVWTGAVLPDWADRGGDVAPAYSATIEIDAGTAFIDQGYYIVTAQPRDPTTGLMGNAVSRSFKVAWEHQAPAPSQSCAVAWDEDARTAKVTLAKPDRAADDDCYDLWRQSPAGWEMIASGLAMDAEVIDRYAPFGDSLALAYRICSRTIDGAIEFADAAYATNVGSVRIDFGDDYVELPWDIDIKDAWSKAFESRAHVDGTVSGYWDTGAKRNGSIATDVVRDDAVTLAGLRRLAEWPGSCFVRLPDGQAFQANVGVSLSESYNRPTAGVTLSVNAVATTREYMPTDDDIS